VNSAPTTPWAIAGSPRPASRAAGNHVLRKLDAVHVHARGHERQRDPADAHGELQRVSTASQPREEGHSRLLVARVSRESL